jgi:hypothetical protein
LIPGCKEKAEKIKGMFHVEHPREEINGTDYAEVVVAESAM